MFAHRSSLCKGLVVTLCAFALASCGSGNSTSAGTATDSTTADTAGADPADLAVIEGWAGALAKGDVEVAAGYFAIPSTTENGPVLIKINSRADAIEFNRSLPCGASVISAQTTGDFTTATFKLADRPGGDCGSGVGANATTSFEIQDGKIVEWRRIDGQPPAGGDQAGGTEV